MNNPMMTDTSISNILATLKGKSKPISQILALKSMYLHLAIMLIISVFSTNLVAQVDITYYLPDIEYDPAIPTPESVIGHQVGEWHISHDKLVQYMEKLAASSDRIIIQEYARSHENRPLLNLIITAPKNLARIDEIKDIHRKLCTPNEADQVNTADEPIVVYQGYSIHGNESSGVNASMLVAYYLAAGQSPEVLNKLENGIFIIDPAYNPDGINRFASWVNSHKSKHLVSDPADREYTEAYPRGRTNHYWFDLNRDWLLLSHPESQGRIKVFHDWKPNILTDHHEMNTNSTFFFQPGIPSRTNPNTPQRNQDLTEEIGHFHAHALDSINSLYYTKSSFDDYYYGKGSTYPDANACVGILFEQASSRGHLQESVNGLLSFPFTIRNQVVTSLSTQDAAISKRKEMLDYQRTFYKNNIKDGKNSIIRGWLYTDVDAYKLKRYNEIMLAHQLEVYPITKDMRSNGKLYKANESYFIPMEQIQSKMAKTIFEKVRTFPDSLFYDVSAWTMPLAFDLQYSEVNKGDKSRLELGKRMIDAQSLKGKLYPKDKTYAYIFDWNQYKSANALLAIQDAGLITKMTHKEIDVDVTKKGEKQNMQFGRGSIIVPLQNQNKTGNEIQNILSQLAQENDLNIFALSTGITKSNMTLGNPDVATLDRPNVMVIVGDGTSSYDAGEIWHTMDQKLGYPLTKMETKDISSTSLKRYNTIVMAHGWYGSLDKDQVENISNWIKQGNTLITVRGGTDWAAKKDLIDLKRYKGQTGKDTEDEYQPYEVHPVRRGAGVIGGAIFETKMDLTHPLSYGYDDDILPVFHRGTNIYHTTNNPYATPLKYTASPILSGYIPRGFDTKIANQAALTVHKLGSGRVIAFQDNPNFRGYWYGGTKQFYNAIFFGAEISSRTMEPK